MSKRVRGECSECGKCRKVSFNDEIIRYPIDSIRRKPVSDPKTSEQDKEAQVYNEIHDLTGKESMLDQIDTLEEYKKNEHSMQDLSDTLALLHEKIRVLVSFGIDCRELEKEIQEIEYILGRFEEKQIEMYNEAVWRNLQSIYRKHRAEINQLIIENRARIHALQQENLKRIYMYNSLQQTKNELIAYVDSL